MAYEARAATRPSITGHSGVTLAQLENVKKNVQFPSEGTRGSRNTRGTGPANAWTAPPPHVVLGKDRFHGESADSWASLTMLSLQRCNQNLGSMMGHAFRNSITGRVKIKNFGHDNDFCVMDLWTRPSLQGTPEQLARDPYLFRPVPMNTRTWIYHDLFRKGTVLEDIGEEAMIRHVLGLYCIDAKGAGGRWGSVMLYMPMLIFLCLTANAVAVICSIIVVILILFIQWIMSTPFLYEFQRIVTWPLRVFLAIFIPLLMVGASDPSPIQTIGYVIALIMCIAEILIGDIGAIFSYRLQCNYEVVRALPNRVFVCRRHGAAHADFGKLIPVNEIITGMGGWQDDYALIADFIGLIVELKPMTLADWQLVAKETQMKEDYKPLFVGLDVYSPGCATIDAVNLAIQEQKDALLRNQWSRTTQIMEVTKEGAYLEDI